MQVALQVASPFVQDGRDLAVHVTVTNNEDRPVTLNTLFLEIPAVTLKIQDALGRPVPGLPPPVPPIDDGQTGREVLAPGQALTFHYNGSSLLSSPLRPGSYTIRFSYEAANSAQAHDWEGVLQSGWTSFIVTG